MTSNAIAAMRLQEEMRHNKAQEEEADKSRKSGFASTIIGSIARGLGTGILAKISPMSQGIKTLASMAQNRGNRNNNRNGGRK